MQNDNIVYINEDYYLKYIKKHKNDIHDAIIIGPSNIIDKIISDEKLYEQLISQHNKFSVNNYKEDK